MTSLDNYRTHFCPDSGFSLISENDAEFEACNCFKSRAQRPVASYSASADAVGERSRLAAEEIWYRSLAALAKVCGTSKTPERVVRESPVHEHAAVESEPVLVNVRKR